MRWRMMARYRQAGQLLGLPLFAAFSLSGCVTTSDLDQLNQQVTGQIEALERTNRAQLGELQAQLDDLRRGNDELRGDLAGLSGTLSDAKSETRAIRETVERSEASRAQMERKLEQEIVRNREGLAAYAGKSAEALRRIAQRSGEVSTEVRSLRSGVMAMLLGTYRAEEAALRERLKTVVETRERLELMTGDSTEVEGPGTEQETTRPETIERAQAED